MLSEIYLQVKPATEENPYWLIIRTDTYCRSHFDISEFEDYYLFHLSIMLNLMIDYLDAKQVEITTTKIKLVDYLAFLGYSETEFLNKMKKSFEAEPYMNIRNYQTPAELAEISLAVNNKIEFWTKTNKIIEAPLFSQKTFEPSPACPPTSMVYSLCVGRNLAFNYDKTSKELSTKKTFKGGIVDLIIKEATEELKNEFGYDTFAICNVLLAYAYRNKKESEIFVSGRAILRLLGNKRSKDENGRKKTIEEKLLWVAGNVSLIRKLDVFIGSWEYKGKIYPLKQHSFLHIDTSFENGDLIIAFRPGAWFDLFCDSTGKLMNQYGYNHREIYSERISLFYGLGQMLRIHQSGDWTIENFLNTVGLENRLTAILTEGNCNKKRISQYNLFRDFHNEINKLKNLTKDPYKIEYRNPPTWLINPEEKKPQGWFNVWLRTVIVIQESEHLRPLEAIEKKKEAKVIKALPPKEEFTVEQLKQAIKSCKSKEASIRQLTEWYGEKHPWLQRRLASGKLTESQIKDFLNRIEFLNKNRK